MYTMLSELVQISAFLREWRGNNSAKVITSNNNVKAYFEKGVDSKINVVLTKQIKKYEIETYNKMIDETFAIEYQSMTVIVSRSKTGILAKVLNRAGDLIGEALIQSNGVKMIKPLENLDANRVIRALAES